MAGHNGLHAGGAKWVLNPQFLKAHFLVISAKSAYRRPNAFSSLIPCVHEYYASSIFIRQFGTKHQSYEASALGDYP